MRLASLLLQDTETFCRQTLCNSDLAHYINHTFVSWGGDVRYPDAYKLSNRCGSSAAGRLLLLHGRLAWKKLNRQYSLALHDSV